jgi:hypothetical protein
MNILAKPGKEWIELDRLDATSDVSDGTIKLDAMRRLKGSS